MERNLQLDWPSLVSEAVSRRKQQRLTQKQLAALVGVSGPTVVHFEKCDANITLKSAMAILRALGLVSSRKNQIKKAQSLSVD